MKPAPISIDTQAAQAYDELIQLARHYDRLGITSASEATLRAADELRAATRAVTLHRDWIERRTMPDGSIGSPRDAARARIG